MTKLSDCKIIKGILINVSILQVFYLVELKFNQEIFIRSFIFVKKELYLRSAFEIR